MGTSSQYLAKARANLGMGDSPNSVTRWYADMVDDVGFVNAPWCNMAVSKWAVDSGNKAAVLPNGLRAYTPWHAEDFQDIQAWYAGTWENVTNYAKPGYIVFFDWGGSNTRSKIDHVGVIEKVLGNGRVQTIEANTGSPGVCARRVRSHQDIAGFGRPAYSAPKPTKPTALKYPYKSSLMRFGWYNSPNVRRVQDQLNKEGYKPALAEDGDFGRKTETAVKWFQRKNKLEVDGIVGPKTWARLFG